MGKMIRSGGDSFFLGVPAGWRLPHALDRLCWPHRGTWSWSESAGGWGLLCSRSCSGEGAWGLPGPFLPFQRLCLQQDQSLIVSLPC